VGYRIILIGIFYLFMALLRGKVLINEEPEADQEVCVFIRLLDTSRADLSSIKVGEVVYEQIRLTDLFSTGLPFQMKIDKVDPHLRYTLSVLVDLDKDGKKGKGDYISKQSYPVLTKGHSDYVEVVVLKI
jgi:uncharacterized lipoprotein YbaY